MDREAVGLLRGSMDSLRKRMAAATSLSMVGIAVTLLTSYPRNLLTARALLPEELGTYTLGGTFFSWFSVALGFGINTSLARYVGKRWGDRKRMSAGVLWAVRTSSAISALGAGALAIAAVASWRFGFISARLCAVFALYAAAIPLSVLKEVSSQVSLGLGRVRQNVLVNGVIAPLAWVLMVLAAWLFDLGLLAVTLAVPAAFAISGFGTWSLTKRALDPPFASPDDMSIDKRDIVVSGVILLVSNFAFSFWLKLDNVFLGIFWGSREVGVYAPAYQTAFLLNYMNVAVASFLSPTVARLLSEGRRGELSSLYLETSRWCFHGNLGIFAVLFVGARPFLALFGADYMAAETVASLRILVAGFFAYSFLTAPPWILLSMSDGQKRLALGEVIMVPVSAAIHLAFTPRLGPVGAAIATSLSLVAAGALRNGLAYRVCGSFSIDKGAYKLIIVSGLSLGAAWLVGVLLPASFWSLPIIYAAAVSVQAAVLLAMRDDSLLSLLRMIASKLSRR